MFHIAICDDSKRFIKYIKKIILENGIEQEDVVFNEYLSIDSFLDNISIIRKCDLLIVDTRIKEIDSLELAMTFRKKFPDSLIVFCSSLYRPTTETIKVTPFRFLLKSYDESKIINEMRDVITEMKRRAHDVKIVVERNKDIVFLRPEEILFVEIGRVGSVVHICDLEMIEGHELKSKRKLKELYEQLQPYGFEMPHNSYIVNMNHIIQMHANREIELIDHTILTVSRSKQKEFGEAFVEWVNRKY